jgi:hypothetical protein
MVIEIGPHLLTAAVVVGVVFCLLRIIQLGGRR